MTFCVDEKFVKQYNRNFIELKIKIDLILDELVIGSTERYLFKENSEDEFI